MSEEKSREGMSKKNLFLLIVLIFSLLVIVLFFAIDGGYLNLQQSPGKHLDRPFEFK